MSRKIITEAEGAVTSPATESDPKLPAGWGEILGGLNLVEDDAELSPRQQLLIAFDQAARNNGRNLVPLRTLVRSLAPAAPEAADEFEGMIIQLRNYADVALSTAVEQRAASKR